MLLALLLSSALSVWLVIEVRKEQRTIDDLMRDSPDVVERVGTLPGELRWQFVFSIVVLVVLIVAAAALVFVFRAYAKSQHSLEEVRALSWNILSSMDHGVITTDRGGIITSINPNGLELLKVDYECVGRSIGEVSGSELPLAQMSRDSLDSGEPAPETEFLRSNGGQLRRLRANCHLLSDAGDHVLGSVLHVRDVTEGQLIEDRMRRMERFMELGTLAAGLHHEIKNPLSALSLHVQLLEEHLHSAVDAETAETLGILKAEVTRIGGVLESFRDFASLGRLNRAEYDISKLLTHTERLLGLQARERGITIDVHLPGGAPTVISVDEAKCEQALLNVVLNAMEAMPDGGQLELRLFREGKFVQIDVSDTGPGIPQDLRKRIFDPYFTSKSDGSGMGLALTEKIMQQHRGTITFETGSDGTVFHLRFPVDDDS